MLAFLAFVGQVAVAAASRAAPSRPVALRAVLHEIEIGGFDALPIIGLTSFLLGVVVAYQGADQLRHYGANIFVVELVGYAMLREFAPLIGAIIIAGRSGSAHAAQIGTMVVTEEIDAMRTIGIDPLQRLVLPKIVALAVALPLLTVFADITGVFGGMVMARSQLGIGFGEFVDRFGRVMQGTALLIGVGKAFVFAFIIVTGRLLPGLSHPGQRRQRGPADDARAWCSRSSWSSWPTRCSRSPSTCWGCEMDRSDAPVIELQQICTRFGSHSRARRAGPERAPRRDPGAGRRQRLGQVGAAARDRSGCSGRARASVLLFGDDIATLDARQALALRQRWGVMFQRGGLFSALTVRRNVGLPLRELSALDDALIDEIAEWKLALTGLPPKPA